MSTCRQTDGKLIAVWIFLNKDRPQRLHGLMSLCCPAEGRGDGVYSVHLQNVKGERVLRVETLRLACDAAAIEAIPRDLETFALYRVIELRRGRLSYDDFRERLRSALRFIGGHLPTEGHA
jgi:hypothetical protein